MIVVSWSRLLSEGISFHIRAIGDDRSVSGSYPEYGFKADDPFSEARETDFCSVGN